MGQQISIPNEFHVRVPESLYEKEYTVLRTSGHLDQGWRIPLRWADEKSKILFDFPSCSKHAETKPGEEKKWRIFMWKESESLNGWRRLETIYPTELTDNEAIEEWRKNTAALLDALEATRVAEGGMTPEKISLKAYDALVRMQKEDEERVSAYETEAT
ncbi:hypothetical protein EBR66_05555 [bacterium]|nr:hypothetical protein [bacterium]